MTINRYRLYAGPLGTLYSLPRVPLSGPPDTPLSMPAAVHTALDGHVTVDRIGRIRRSWTIGYDWLTEDEELVAQSLVRRSANAPLRVYDPRRRNSLPEDVSTGGSSSLSVVAFTDIGAATPVFLAADVPTVFSGILAGGVNWPAVTNAQQLWGTFEQHPVLSGSTYRFSVYVKGSTTFKLGARPFIGAVEQANVLDATNNTATGAWTRFSWLYTPAVGVTSAYFGLNATGSGNLQTTGWMVQTDEALKAWTFGHGCPEIAANVSVAASYWKLRSKFQLVLQEV
jgi:hypothetical protein